MKKNRLPPNQKLTNDFPVLHYGSIPQFDEKTWDFTTSGLIEKPLRLTFSEFLSLPSVEITADFHCVTGWSKFDLIWKGVLFTTIASMTKPLQTAKFVNIIAEHGYTTNIPLEVAMDEDVIFAYQYSGKLLTPEHGFPLRLVVPKKYAYKSAKWVRSLEFLAEDKPGFWEVRGYSNSADPWKEERYG